MKKKILVLIVLVMALGGGAYLLLNKKANGVQFKTMRVTRGGLQAMVTATGTVNAVKNVLVGTQVSGTIKEIFVDYNSLVKKGQMLAQIDPAVPEARVAQARANLQAAAANVEKAQAALTDADRTLERNRTLFAKNYIARSDLDSADTARTSAQAQLTVAKAQVEQQKATLNQEETNLNYTRILSPVNGIVISRSVDIGQTVAASFQTPTLFSIAEDLTRMQIDTNIDEADIGKLKVGQTVQFTVDAYPDTTFRGSVGEIRNAPTTVQNVVTYNIIVKVANPDLKLKPGMTANVSIITAEEQAILMIPNAALRFKYQPADSAPQRADRQTSAAAEGPEQPQGARAGKQVAGTDAAAGPERPQGGRAGEQVAGSDAAGRGQWQGRRTAGSDAATGPERPQGARAGTQMAGSDAAAGQGQRQGRRTAGMDTAAGQGQSQAGRAATPAASAFIWVLDGNQEPRRVTVTLGISDGNSTAVLSGELREGDAVITGASGQTNTNNSGDGRPDGPGGPRMF